MNNNEQVPSCPYCGEEKGIDIINSIPSGNKLGDGTYKCECQRCGTHTEDLPFKRDALEEFFVNSNVVAGEITPELTPEPKKCPLMAWLSNIFN